MKLQERAQKYFRSMHEWPFNWSLIWVYGLIFGWMYFGVILGRLIGFWVAVTWPLHIGLVLYLLVWPPMVFILVRFGELLGICLEAVGFYLNLSFKQVANQAKWVHVEFLDGLWLVWVGVATLPLIIWMTGPNSGTLYGGTLLIVCYFVHWGLRALSQWSLKIVLQAEKIWKVGDYRLEAEITRCHNTVFEQNLLKYELVWSYPRSAETVGEVFWIEFSEGQRVVHCEEDHCNGIQTEGGGLVLQIPFNDSAIGWKVIRQNTNHSIDESFGPDFNPFLKIFPIRVMTAICYYGSVTYK